MDIEKLKSTAAKIQLENEWEENEKLREESEKLREKKAIALGDAQRRLELLRDALTLEGECYLDVWTVELLSTEDSLEVHVIASWGDNKSVVIEMEVHEQGVVDFIFVNPGVIHKTDNVLLGSLYYSGYTKNRVLEFSKIVEKLERVLALLDETSESVT